uniref:Uncharacterized protein n=1 Tax=Cacopsylla melanoneura TaxID=428564 RepID=A0A8D8UUT9_9HEMI
MAESGFTSCEDEMLENVTASLVSSYTDGATWKSSSSSSVESLTKCEELELDEERDKPSDASLMKEKPFSPLKHKPKGWNDSNRTPYVEQKQWRWNVDNATPCAEHKSRSWHDPDLTTCVEENRGWEDGEVTPCVEHKPWGWKDPDATPCVERRSPWEDADRTPCVEHRPRWNDGGRTPCVEHKSELWDNENRVYSTNHVSNKTRWDHVDTPRPDHKPPRWEDAGRWAEPAPRPKTLPGVVPDSPSLSPRIGGEVRSFRRSGIPIVQTPQPQPSTPLPSKLLTKCQSLQDLSKCLAMIHTDRLNNTYNSTDTINSQSLSSTKDSGFQRSYSSNSICSVRRRNKYEHVESKVKQYIRNIKDNERKHKELKRNSMHETELDTPTSRGSFQDTELFAETVSGSGGSKSCCNTRRSSYQDELRVLFNIDDESNRALTTLIKKLEVEKFERDLLIENLQVKYHELNNKLTSANETISDLKHQVTVSPLATSAQCTDEPSTNRPRPLNTRRYSERSYQHHMKRRLSPVHSQSSQASRHQSCTDTKGPPQEPAPCCSSRSSQNSSRLNKGHAPAQPPHPPSRKKLNLPREDPFLKVKRWQDSLTGVDTSCSDSPGVSYPDPITSSPSDSGPGVSYLPVTPSPLQKSSTLASLPPSPITPPQSSHTPKTPRTFFKAFDSSFHLGRSKTSPDIKRSTVYINIGDHSSKKIKPSPPVVDENSNLCSPAKELSTPPKKQITVLKIYEAEDGTKVVQDVSKRRGATSRQQSVESNATTKIEVNQTSSPRPGSSSPQCIPVSPLDVNSNPDSGLPPSSPLTKQSQSSMKAYGLSQSKTTPNMKRVSINLSTDIRSSTESSDSLNTTTEDELPGGLTRRPPSVPPNTRLFKVSYPPNTRLFKCLLLKFRHH